MIFTVAIDGPAASGKGTISRALAARFGFRHLDTGLLYRAVGARVLAGEEPLAAARALDPDRLGEAALRTQAVAEAASVVAALPEVRAALVAFQRRSDAPLAAAADAVLLDTSEMSVAAAVEEAMARVAAILPSQGPGHAPQGQ